MRNPPTSRTVHGLAWMALLFLAWACSPTPPTTTCTQAKDCSHIPNYTCELGYCVPNTSPYTQSNVSSENPHQPPLFPSESTTQEPQTTEPTTSDGLLPESSTTEPAQEGSRIEGHPVEAVQEGSRIEGHPVEAVQDGGNIEAPPTETTQNDNPPEIEPTDPPPTCVGNETRPCTTKKVGPCAIGEQTCQQGDWSDCQDTYTPQEEFKNCADGVDNDCDGKTDTNDTKPAGCKWDIDHPANTTNGKLRWVATTPHAGALYILGEYLGKPALPLQNQQIYTFPSTTTKRGFLAKLHPTGYFEWIRVFWPNTADTRFRPTALTFHPDPADPTKGSIFLAGHFGGALQNTTPLSLHPTTIQTTTSQTTTPSLLTDTLTAKLFAIFVLQYDAAGNFVRASKMDTYTDGTQTTAEYFSANAILYANNALYVAGGIWGKFEYPDPKFPQSIKHVRAYDRRHPYLIRFSTNTSKISVQDVYFFTPGGNATSEVFGLAFDAAQQKIFAAGSTIGGLSLQQYPAPTTSAVAGYGGHDAFLVTLNNDLTSPTIRLFGSSGDDFARGLVYDPQRGFFLFGEAFVGSGLPTVLYANFRPKQPNDPNIASIDAKGQRTAFLAHWSPSYQAQWIFGVGSDNFKIQGTQDTFLNQASATHLALHNNTLYLAGLFRGDLAYYQGHNTTSISLSKNSTGPNATNIQRTFANKLADNFLLAINPTTGALASNNSYRIIENTSLSAPILRAPAGISFDPHNVAYLFLNQEDPAFLQATTSFEIFATTTMPPPYKAEIFKHPLPR
ncbi:hypothetical protein L6R29_19055 [Myxococcota bacterium]|nr:hypothetical protein [Myxococcota bacterium]